MMHEVGNAWDYDSEDEYSSAMYRRNMAMDNAKRRVARNQRRQMYRSAGRSMMGGLSELGSIPAMGRFGIAGAVGYGALRAAQFNQNMSSRFGDISRFEGSLDYQKAYAFKQMYNQPEMKLDLVDQFMMGLGPEGTKGLANFSKASGQYMRNVGRLVENPYTAFTGNPAANLLGVGGIVPQQMGRTFNALGLQNQVENMMSILKRTFS
jgi:hypothetical protein